MYNACMYFMLHAAFMYIGIMYNCIMFNISGIPIEETLPQSVAMYVDVEASSSYVCM